MIIVYTNGKYIYSVDLMHAYINNKKPSIKKLKMDILLKNLEYNCWGEPEKTIRY
jgi:hypothetical protein